jgi:hypothetical protein
MPQLKPFRGLQLNKVHPLARGLVGCWLMNEGGGNIIYDFVNRLNITGAGTTGLPTWTAGNHGAALNYISANSQYHQVNTAPQIAGYPFSVIAWFNSNDTVNGQSLFWFGNGSLTNVYWGLLLYTGKVCANARNTSDRLDTFSSVAYSANTWNMAAGVWLSSTSRAAYLNGGNKGTGIGAANFGTCNRTAIGMYRDFSPGFPMSGKIGLAMVWNRALSDAEIRWLYREMFPMFEPSRGRERIYALGPEVWLTGSAEAQSATSAVLKQLHRLVGSALAQSQVSAVCEIIRKVSSIAASVSDATGLLKTVRDVAASIGGLAAVDGTISIAGETLLAGVVTGTAALSGTLILSIRQPWFGGSLEIERQWLREVLFNCVSANAIKLGTALTSGWFWVRVCGCSALYRGAGMEQMDFTNILAVAAKDACEIRPPSYLPHDSNSTYFYVIRRFNNCGYQERTLGAAVKVSIETSGELARLQPNNIFDSKAEQVNGNKIQLVWFYCPLEQKSKPVCFKIYWDSWTGQVDYENPTAIISYQGRKYYSYETGALEAGRYLFAIRAEDVHGVENNSLSQSRINLCTGSPDSINILSAETI